MKDRLERMLKLGSKKRKLPKTLTINDLDEFVFKNTKKPCKNHRYCIRLFFREQ